MPSKTTVRLRACVHMSINKRVLHPALACFVLVPCIVLLLRPFGTTTAPRAALRFRSLAHDFGNVPRGTVLTHTFEFTNVGDIPITVDRVQGSCGCLAAPEIPQGVVAPGQGSRIVVSIDTGKINANDVEFHKEIKIQFTAGNKLNRATIVLVRGEIHDPVRIEPKRLVLDGSEPIPCTISRDLMPVREFVALQCTAPPWVSVTEVSRNEDQITLAVNTSDESHSHDFGNVEFAVSPQSPAIATVPLQVLKRRGLVECAPSNYLQTLGATIELGPSGATRHGFRLTTRSKSTIRIETIDARNGESAVLGWAIDENQPDAFSVWVNQQPRSLLVSTVLVISYRLGNGPLRKYPLPVRVFCDDQSQAGDPERSTGGNRS